MTIPMEGMTEGLDQGNIPDAARPARIGRASAT